MDRSRLLPLLAAVIAIAVMVDVQPPQLATARKATAHELERRAHGKPHLCDVHRDGRWSKVEVKCAILVVAHDKGMDAEHLDDLAGCESNHNPRDVNGSSGAMGLMQFLPSTWATLHLRGRAGSKLRRYARWVQRRDPYDPVESLRATYVLWLADGRSYREWSCEQLV